MSYFEKINNYFSEPVETVKEKIIIESSFKLPIEYLKNEEVKNISKNVSNDLELIENPDPKEKNMYQLL